MQAISSTSPSCVGAPAGQPTLIDAGRSTGARILVLAKLLSLPGQDMKGCEKTLWQLVLRAVSVNHSNQNVTGATQDSSALMVRLLLPTGADTQIRVSDFQVIADTGWRMSAAARGGSVN